MGTFFHSFKTVKQMNKLIAMAMLLFPLVANAQDLSLFQKHTFTAADGKTLPYRILFPEYYDKNQKYPLLLFLHGAGERGNDNEKQLVHGAKLFLSEAGRRDFPGIILMPQCPAEGYWSSANVDRTKTPLIFDFDYTRPPTPSLAMVMDLLRQVLKEESVDQTRLYIAGLSMGGMGTFEAVHRHPKLFAAAMPICGGGDAVNYSKKVKKMPFWVFHGTDDGVVVVRHSREMVEKLKQVKAQVAYAEYPGVNHNSWDNAFAEPDFLKWLMQHKRKKSKF